MNLNTEIEFDKERIRPEKSEVERLWADNSKAINFLDWAPKYSQILGFEKGVQETINWFDKTENKRNYLNTGYVT
jgi:dTDP-glucose 4,6-dehydratase